ncbi:uncharacterized protein LOC122756908 [Drosophila mojavensis]|uniref:uncharacterized protein LOC122756908 n=1 Tax=Drosophila mojavensis TaxID=7230 RepID=UPI001CD0F4F3|nr:uncharacterized protein LOC122756908 [Drosophila mojavensis]
MDFVDNQVRWSTWACPEAVLRQCHQFRGCCTHAGPQSYVPWQHSGHGNVCCGAGHGVCIHPSSSAAFWRPLGSGGEIRQRFAAESDGQRSITARRGGHRAGRGRGRAQFAANGRSQQQPQRRRSAHARALPDRSNARAAANRVHRASRRRQADTIKRWQLTSNIKRRFWNDWSRDYLLSLQQKSKWTKERQNIQVGAVVLVGEDNAPPQQWMLGVVTEAIVGGDGRVRVIVVKTKNGTYKRAIHRVAPLPLH